MKNKEKVLKVVEDYINSAYESDGAMTRKIFDDDARVTGNIKGKLIRQTKEDWGKFVELLGYKYWDETNNQTYKLFLGASD